MQLRKQGGTHGPPFSHPCKGHQVCKCKREGEALKANERCKIGVNYIRDVMNTTYKKKKHTKVTSVIGSISGGKVIISSTQSSSKKAVTKLV